MVHLEHPFEPIFNEKSEILILGSFPSVVSRKQNFYYAHPQNRFWKIIIHLTKTDPIPNGIEGKKSMLLAHKIALWDVIQSCNIEGSKDNYISNVIPVNLFPLLENAPLRHIFTNGHRAYQLYNQYLSPNIRLPVSRLPSTSPANATYSLEKLIYCWDIIK
ncbi:MAG: DNA-deoxyinosine glycosylase [Puniceicoccales bacterium]|jgi:hypoxanthine-DNA glycosylase|nr:DNA-deoxyinosine glycosylase [Puniceicoccales bacterium]